MPHYLLNMLTIKQSVLVVMCTTGKMPLILLLKNANSSLVRIYGEPFN